MTFINLQVDCENLPRAQELELQPMSPAYRREVLVQFLLFLVPVWLLSFIPMFVAPVSGTPKLFLVLLPVLIGLLFGLLIGLALKKVSLKGYAVREHDIAYRSGLIWRKTVLLPFNRVQHAEVASGPLQRRFGLASLKFFTAGGASVDLKMEGLDLADAGRLREYIMSRALGDGSV